MFPHLLHNLYWGFIKEQMKVILASESSTRKKLLKNAGVKFLSRKHNIAESRLKTELMVAKKTNRQIALALAMAKANSISKSFPKDLIIGSDQILICEKKIFNKPRNRKEAFNQLSLLTGKQHKLLSAVCVVLNQKRLWFCVKTASLRMKKHGTDVLRKYFQELKKNQGYSVGVYRYEIDNGALFDWVKGKRETILGMPTKELLLFLKRTGVC